ncbi:hypothetical protein [Desulfovibrio inopinatus]|uniref:hypothetical protein n=1 Tax=Desulfovibrio inopinatus TaxID=102109 RepID=UPI0012EB2B93|nr:hypothetical protein [Desulfovibrio inopinatus]
MGASLTWLVRDSVNVQGALSGASDVALQRAAQRLATGDLVGAHRLLPKLSLLDLTSIYANAFQSLVFILFIMTLISSAAIFLLFSQAKRMEDEKG